MSLKVKTGKIKNYHSVEIHGNIIGDDASRVTAKVEQLLKKKLEVIIIHFNNTTIIDSHGLGAFVYIWKLLNSAQIKLIFFCPKNHFDLNLFQNTNLDKLFTIITSVEEL